jgi:hypothetical protein
VIKESYEGYGRIPPLAPTRGANSRSQELEFTGTSGTLEKPVADKNVVGLQVGVSSTNKVCPARLTWSSSVRDDVLVQKDDNGVVTGVIPD